MCDVVLELAREGKSVFQICADERINIGVATFYRWCEEREDFRETVTRAKDLCRAWWEDAGQKGMWLGGGGFNANAWSLQIRNRFPEAYSDRRDVGLHGAAGGPIKINWTTEIVEPPERGE